MSKTLETAAAAVAVAEIVHHGEKLILPEGLSLDAAMDLIQRRKEYENEKVHMVEDFDVFPWDGASALDAVLTRRYGWSPAKATPGLFGPNPPRLISIEVGPSQVKQVTWGAFSLPNIKGTVITGVGEKDGRLVFQVEASITRRDEQTVRALFDDLRTYLKSNSIYRGKAIKLRFRDDNGCKLEMPEPKFLETNDVDETMLVYPEAVNRSIRTNLFTPIKRVKDCIANGITVKRGVLLGGTFGTGKTMAAKVASKYATQEGVTYLYIPRADELADAIEFAKQYQSPACVIFCEDIDRAVSGERSVEMDDILNIIDGIDTKTANIIVVMTTNNLTAIHPAMLRPGRLDAVIEVLPPDAPAVERLLRLYGGAQIAPGADLTRVASLLAGQIPAVVAEVVKRAKLAQLALQEPGTVVNEITEDALLDAASSMQAQLNLLKAQSDAEHRKDAPTMDDVLVGVVKRAIQPLHEKAEEIYDAL